MSPEFLDPDRSKSPINGQQSNLTHSLRMAVYEVGADAIITPLRWFDLHTVSHFEERTLFGDHDAITKGDRQDQGVWGDCSALLAHQCERTTGSNHSS